MTNNYIPLHFAELLLRNAVYPSEECGVEASFKPMIVPAVLIVVCQFCFHCLVSIERKRNLTIDWVDSPARQRPSLMNDAAYIHNISKRSSKPDFQCIHTRSKLYSKHFAEQLSTTTFYHRTIMKQLPSFASPSNSNPYRHTYTTTHR